MRLEWCSPSVVKAMVEGPWLGATATHAAGSEPAQSSFTRVLRVTQWPIAQAGGGGGGEAGEPQHSGMLLLYKEEV